MAEVVQEITPYCRYPYKRKCFVLPPVNRREEIRGKRNTDWRAKIKRALGNFGFSALHYRLAILEIGAFWYRLRVSVQLAKVKRISG